MVRNGRVWLVIGAITVLAGLGLTELWRNAEAGASAQSVGQPAGTMVAAARQLLATLDAEQLARVKFPFESEERLNWHFIPRERKGLPLKAMNERQRQATFELLKVGLSQDGYTKIETIRSLESVLAVLEKERERKGPIRDTELYFLTIFGEPSPDGIWGWRYEGHHISQNWTIVAGRGIASSPQFLGANPAEVRDGPMKGTRALAAQEDLARALLASLTPEQRTTTIVAAQAPRDIVTGNERQIGIQEETGVSYASLDAKQQAMLVSIIEEYTRVQPAELATKRLGAVRKGGLNRVKFAWMGSVEKGQGHYYRIQGPTFLIEHDNTQNSANHIHSVWRDFRGDFGRDLLADHYRTQAH